MNTFIVFSFNLVKSMLSNIDYFYIGCPTQLKKNKRENGPSQQLLSFVIDTILIPKDKIKLLITGSGIWF